MSRPFIADFYIDRAGRSRVSLEGYNSIGFKDMAEAEEVHRRIKVHAPATVAQLRAVTGLNKSCLAKLLKRIDN